MPEKKDEFQILIDRYGATLDEKTLEKLLDSQLTNYPQIWTFLITFVFTLLFAFIGLDFKPTTIETAIIYLSLTLIFALFVGAAVISLFGKNPLVTNSETIIKYEAARQRLEKLKKGE